jgi:hypothetical protein
MIDKKFVETKLSYIQETNFWILKKIAAGRGLLVGPEKRMDRYRPVQDLKSN